MANRIVALLNSSRSGHIFDLESEGVRDLINEYFTQTDPDREDEETDDQSDDTEPETIATSDVPESMSVDNDDSDEDLELGSDLEEPIVNVGEAADRGVECNGAPAETIRVFAEWSCRCSQIKVPQPAQCDTRTGCCTQFTPEEMMAYNDSIRGMPDQGMLNITVRIIDFFGTISFEKKSVK